ncbi:Porphobilinogen deaminase [Fragilaria crotonensis]|nr:Porphobilinogen deaminase [Fragilaria crotonensis]
MMFNTAVAVLFIGSAAAFAPSPNAVKGQNTALFMADGDVVPLRIGTRGSLPCAQAYETRTSDRKLS